MSTIRIWTVAATSPFKAFRNFVTCLQCGHEAAIKRVRNEDALHNAIRVKNPDLNHHENWKAGSAYPQSEAQLAARCYFNDVERDLTYNWDTVFSRKEHQWVLVHKKPLWPYQWHPKQDIPYWVPKPMKRKVFIVVITPERTFLSWLFAWVRCIPRRSFLLDMGRYTIRSFCLFKGRVSFDLRFPTRKKRVIKQAIQ